MITSPVMTGPEACEYLRLTEGRDIEAAMRALTRLIDEKKAIRPLLYTARRMFHRDELDRFLKDQLK